MFFTYPTYFKTIPHIIKTIRIWDTRIRDKSMLWTAAHKTDVNVMSWNKSVAYLLVSGADDGSIKGVPRFDCDFPTDSKRCQFLPCLLT